MKTKRTVRIISLILALIILLSAFVTAITVFAESYPVTYKNTGNQLEDILGVAKTQIGYTESGNDETKYCDWYGYNAPWCCIFVAWCAEKANIPSNIISRYPGCISMFNSFPASAQHTSHSYMPKRGDLVYLSNYTSVANGDYDHIGIVYSVNGDEIVTIEGNCSNAVKSVTRPRFGYSYGQYVVAYTTPAYKNTSTNTQPSEPNVPSTVSVKDIFISESSTTIYIGDTLQLTSRIEPSNATNKNVSWSSSDTSVATVDNSGKVTGKAYGTTFITVKSADGNHTASCYLGVYPKPAALSEIKITSQPKKIKYAQGVKFSSSGLKVTAYYSDKTSKDVTSQCTLSGTNTDKLGTNKVTVSYTEKGVTKNASFDINVVAKTTKLEIEKMPKKTRYALNEELDVTGIKVRAYFSDGTSRTVMGVAKYSGFDSKTPGTKTVTVKYTSSSVTVSTSFKVEVVGLTDIKIESLPKKVKYAQDKPFSSNGMVIKAVYSDKTEKDVTSKCTLSGTQTDKIGAGKVTVSYTEAGITKKASFDISVVARVTHIVVEKLPDKTTYALNEELNVTGIKVRAYFTDGSSRTVMGAAKYSGFSSKKTGTKTVTVKYTSSSVTVSTTFNVKVTSSPVLVSMLLKKPAKINYVSGEKLNTAGMKLTLTYSDGSKRAITSGWVTSAFNNAPGKHLMYVTYTENGVTLKKNFYYYVTAK